MTHAQAHLDPHPAPGSLPPRRTSRLRQVFMALLLLLFVSIILAHWVVTDSGRVRSMAESYLSKIIGGRVVVGKASLSFFEGLRLDDVSIYVDDLQQKDSCLFTAETFLVRTSLRALFSGRLEATQIMALHPQVHLCENLDAPAGKRWNYQRLTRQNIREKSSSSDHAMVLPEILLRAGLIDYSRIAGGPPHKLGTMAIDGQLTPDTRRDSSASDNRYLFELDSRAPGQPLGPHLSGALDMDGPTVSANLQDFEFNDAIRAMLPAQVQAWWESHQLAGRIRVPRFEYSPARDGSPQSFHIEVLLDDVRLAILPEELLDSQEYQDLVRWRPGIRVGGLPDIGLVTRTQLIEKTLQPQPVTLTGVSGRLIFTPQQIRLAGIRGKAEGNPLTIDGAVHGYKPDVPLSLRLIANNVTIPRLPRFMNSIPFAVRKIYSDFKPYGRVGVYFQFDRPQSGGKLQVTGQVNVYDAGFCFFEFPYPMQHVSGQITLGPDPTTGEPRIDLIGLRGAGVEGTRNGNNWVFVDGHVSPLGKGSGVNINISGPRVWLDRDLRSALPPDVREVMDMFDTRARPNPAQPDRKPPVIAPVDVRGNFEARIRRPVGRKRKVIVEVDLNIEQATGQFAAFPYPLRDVTGQILVRFRYTEVHNMLTRNGDATLQVDGRLDYGPDRPVDPKLTITARNVPIDDDLRSSLPPQQQEWLSKVGMTGILNVDGRVFRSPDAPKDEQIDFDLDLALRNGAIWPVAKTHAVTAATADLRLTRSQLTINQFKGKRGPGNLTGRGIIAWPDDQLQFGLAANLIQIPLDNTLYQLIPAASQHSWDTLRPQGVVDLDISYSGGIQPAGETATSSSSNETYEVTIRPRSLTVNPVGFPWPMQHVAGSALLTPDKTTLRDVVLKHGPATLKLSGTNDHAPQSPWVFSLAGDSIPLNDELRKALPDSVRSFLDSIKAAGKLSFNCPQITYRTLPPTAAGSAPSSSIEFKSHLTLTEGSFEAGLPLTAIDKGSADLDVVIQDGALHSLAGTLDVPSLQAAYRSMRNLRGEIIKPAGTDAYLFKDLHGKLAGGNLVIEQIAVGTPKDGTPSYLVRLKFKDVDVAELSANSQQNIKGRLDGYLDVRGSWADPNSRHGSGVAQIQGKELYQIPAMFGLLQVANLSLPGSKPFNDATAEYTIRGQQVVFEKIVLRSPSMLMLGNATLDFATRRVHMSFMPDNPGIPNIPVFGDILDAAKREVFPIEAYGTIEELRIQARPMNTFRTVLEVISDKKKK
ncbi:MAG TPA: hypothetical protein VHP11_04380 [Tepidisphaeraceae bacterium]|nr:hypothetical protein [Tepidisphaeraceae bacterium]